VIYAQYSFNNISWKKKLFMIIILRLDYDNFYYVIYGHLTKYYHVHNYYLNNYV